jgi:hypothetical protein
VLTLRPVATTRVTRPSEGLDCEAGVFSCYGTLCGGTYAAVMHMSTGPVPTSSWDGPRNGSRSTARRHTYVAWLLIVRTAAHFHHADHLDAEAA